MERFLQLFGGFVDFTYGAWDRIVLRGYYERLQRPANIVYFFRNVCGLYPITPEVLAERTKRYRKWVDGYAALRGITIVSAPKGARKEDFVLPFYRRFLGDEGVVVILKSLEKAEPLSPMNLDTRHQAVKITGRFAILTENISCITTSTFSTLSWDPCA